MSTKICKAKTKRNISCKFINNKFFFLKYFYEIKYVLIFRKQEHKKLKKVLEMIVHNKVYN